MEVRRVVPLALMTSAFNRAAYISALSRFVVATMPLPKKSTSLALSSASRIPMPTMRISPKITSSNVWQLQLCTIVWYSGIGCDRISVASIVRVFGTDRVFGVLTYHKFSAHHHPNLVGGRGAA